MRIIDRVMKEQRNGTIDILKGIGICLVVIGHSNCPIILRSIIYSFHMPLFFIASGFFFKEKYLYNLFDFIKKKVKSLYIPFAKWSVIFLLLHNLFFFSGIINQYYGNSSGICSYEYSLKEIVLRLLNIITRMTDYEDFLLGAFWFLRSLFVGNILICLFAKLGLFLFKEDKSIYLAAFLGGTLGGVFSYFNIHLPFVPQGGYRELMAIFFIGMGYSLSKKKTSFSNVALILLIFLIFIICLFVHPSSMDIPVSFADWLFSPVEGIVGFILLYRLSDYINSRNSIISSIISYIGRSSFYILTFHFLMFKPASLLKAYLYGYDWRVIGSHTVINDNVESFFWVVYSISAICLSLLFKESIFIMNRWFISRFANNSERIS